MPHFETGGIAAIDALFAFAVKHGDLPGVVAAVTNTEQTVYASAFGKQTTNLPMSPDTLFRIASMTKPVTSVAVMMLCEDGLLSLDDPAGAHVPRGNEIMEDSFGDNPFPRTRPATKQIRLKHLLTHTAGLSYDFTSHLVARLHAKTGVDPISLPLLFEPGTDWRYSPATTVLGRIINEVTGKSLEELFQERILRPLGMRDTSYLVPPQEGRRLATVYRRSPHGFSEVETADHFQRNESGSSGLVSTAGDYSAFLRMFLNDGTNDSVRVIGPDTVFAMTSNQIGDLVVRLMPKVRPEKAEPFPTGAGRDKFGFGFQVAVPRSAVAHARSAGSYSWGGSRNTHFWVDPQKSIAAIMLTQVVPYYDPVVMHIFEQFETLVYQHLR